MATNAPKPTEIVIDPSFLIPDGVSELVHGEGNLVITQGEEDPYTLGPDEYLVDPGELYDIPSLIDVPTNFTVVEQIIRTVQGGMQVVDVVIDVEDVPGAQNYEAHYTII